MFRFSHITGALVALALAAPAVAMAQDGSRIVMRRPLDPVSNSSSNPNPDPTSPPTSCGGPGNPCPDRCEYWDPRWVLPEGDPDVCVGQSVAGTAVCKAFTSANRDTDPIAVPDAVCQEDEASYHARCG